ncbi:MAG: hypothetical protein CL573_06680 [Alphaproteobacteria bacterium]|nr:hypothetical protein [Alphaproteobacteria bacterium]HCP00920.1 hypothetical protein [Rhodospirillaceae bacterium]|tara:strand:+ start:363 stop:869 length:507 start_codon:yes stop_codon:yes gene_type:complete
MNGVSEQEFQRLLSVAELRSGECMEEKLEADEGECFAIAGRLGILSVDSLIAELQLFRDLTGDVNLRGRLVADIAQACVVTLDPVAQRVVTNIFQRFSARNDDEEETEEDPIEPIVEDEIEVGDVIVQNLALSLDAYPRVPKAVFEEVDDEAGKATGPFAALSALRGD